MENSPEKINPNNRKNEDQPVTMVGMATEAAAAQHLQQPPAQQGKEHGNGGEEKNKYIEHDCYW